MAIFVMLRIRWRVPLRRQATSNSPAQRKKTAVHARRASDDHHSAVDFLLDWLERQKVFASVTAVRHKLSCEFQMEGSKHWKMLQ
jgi:hypothetical protein